MPDNEGTTVTGNYPLGGLIDIAKASPAAVISFILIYGIFFSVPNLTKTFTDEQAKQREAAARELQTFRDRTDIKFEAIQKQHHEEFTETIHEQRRLTGVIEQQSRMLTESVELLHDNNKILERNNNLLENRRPGS